MGGCLAKKETKGGPSPINKKIKPINPANDKREFWEISKDNFETLFESPTMDPVLLLRPPFRYIHDIIMSTFIATGFGEGVLVGSEDISGSIHSTDRKV
jgi:hypothetical protein